MIYALGEALIDLIAVDEGDLKYVERFEKHPGGDSANVAVGLKRLGVPSGLIGKIGEDLFGEFLIEKLAEEGVEIKYLVRSSDARTGVVLMQSKPIKQGLLTCMDSAHFQLRIEEVDKSFFENAELLHVSGITLSREPCRSTSIELAREARRRRLPVSFDANIRPHLWQRRRKEFVEAMREISDLADVIKLDENEEKIFEDNGMLPSSAEEKLIAVTMEDKGCRLIHVGEEVEIPAYRAEAVDTTGAGDAYLAALLAALYHMKKIPEISLSVDELQLVGRFANLVAALSITKRGAWTVPRLDELMRNEMARSLVEEIIGKVRP